jgi:NADH-quinone oxidoreductase subunit D
VELGYSRIGLEERVAEGRLEWGRALELVEGICACCSQANTLALVHAVEAMAKFIVPPRAAYLRMVLAEIERVISHLSNAAATMQALGLTHIETVLRDLRERLVQAVADWSGARTRPALITYGGLVRNIDDALCRALALAVRHIERALRAHVIAATANRELAARLVGLGVITAQEAVIAGLRGPVLRASGIPFDIRASWPTGAYEEEGVTIVTQRAGDAFARLMVRLLECLESLRIIEQALDDLPGGSVKARGSPELREGSGIGRVEGPRGEVFCWVRGGPDGPRALHLSAPSLPNLGVVAGLMRGRKFEDIHLLLLSLDLCISSAER